MTQSPARRLRPLINDSQKWDLLAGYLEDSIENLRNQLETCGPSDLQTLQGRVQAQRELLNLKATLIADRNA